MDEEKKIIIIGAGLAGLAAAKKLTADGFDVTILETRNRIGGRTWTDYSMGIPFDLGAFIIHGLTNNPIAQLAEKYNCQTQPIGLDSIFFTEEHTQYNSEELNKFYEQFNELLFAASQFANSNPEDMTLEEALKITLKNHPTALSNSKIFNWYKLFLTLYTGTDSQNLSAKHWNDEVPLEGGHHLMVTGYGPIVKGLAAHLNIELNTEVNAINYSRKQVEIETNKGKLVANTVIITIPLGALKKNTIKFTPELSERKQESLSRIEMGVLNKILLKFPSRFWPAEYRIFSYLSNDYDAPAFFHNFSLYYQQPFIMCSIAGKMAIEFEKMNDEHLTQAVMSTLQRMFGSSIPKPESSFITRWASDPHSFGSYSHTLVGGSSQDYGILSEPIQNKIYFAGEATHREYPATTHGAYLSGIREAQRICQLKTNTNK